MSDESQAAPAVTNANPYRIADPVVDLGRGRSMVVIDAPEQTVAEWSDANNYDLQENYTNGKFDPDAEEYVIECVYTSGIQSEPSKTYTFPVSRVALIDVHHADDGRRLADRVAADLLEAMFTHALARGESMEVAWLEELAVAVGVDADAVDEARELADVDQTISSED